MYVSLSNAGIILQVFKVHINDIIQYGIIYMKSSIGL